MITNISVHNEYLEDPNQSCIKKLSPNFSRKKFKIPFNWNIYPNTTPITGIAKI